MFGNAGKIGKATAAAGRPIYAGVAAESCDRFFHLVAAVLYAISGSPDEGTEVVDHCKRDDHETSSELSMFGATQPILSAWAAERIPHRSSGWSKTFPSSHQMRRPKVERCKLRCPREFFSEAIDV